ncbi:MAG: M48 family metallopeptidase [Methylophilaceae bacterium]
MFKRETRESISLNNEIISYTLIKTLRKTITLRVNENGLLINAPFIVSKNRIDELIFQKRNWVLTKLNWFNQKNQKSKLENNLVISILNQRYTVKIIKGKNKVFLKDGTCWIQTKILDDAKYIEILFINWLKNFALNFFEEETRRLAMLHGFSYRSVKISNAKTRWGTCNGKGVIRLNWRLILSRPEIVNYVICHELSHLTHMNHSSKFWSLVEELCPNYKSLSKELKQQGISLYRFG